MKLTNPTIALVLPAALAFSVACGSFPQLPSSESEASLSRTWLPQPADGTPALRSTVALVRPDAEFGMKAFCSGTLIGQRLVMTAAHCVAPSASGSHSAYDLYVQFGSQPGVAAPTRRVMNQIWHPGFDPEKTRAVSPGTAPNDIALLHLESPAPTGFHPIPVSQTQIRSGQGVVPAGYGSLPGRFSDDAQPGPLKAKAAAVSRVEPELKRFWTRLSPSGLCQGDSGGPVYVQNGERWYVSGVVSAGRESPSGQCGRDNTYTDASRYAAWIYATSFALGDSLATEEDATGSFDARFYLARYNDVASLCRNNLRCAARHFSETGWREGREFWQPFNLQAYISSWPELERFCQGDTRCVKNHWYQFGIKNEVVVVQ